MTSEKLNKIFAFSIFIIALITYLVTLQPSVSFWDCGEFIASSHLLQVPHPPGTPFFLILGRLFAMIPFAENIAFRVNLISVLSSAFTILFLYLITVKLIENWKNKTHDNLWDALGTYTAAAIGALSLAFSDTFWFNAVEAEVYALSSFFIAFVTWLMMLWNERADEPDNEKYLIMIAYLLGLSTGVHLLSVLAIVPVVMTIMFRKYLSDEEILKKTAYIFVGHVVILLIIALGLWASLTESVPPSPEAYQKVDTKFLWAFGGVSIFYMAAFWKKIFRKNSFYLPLIFGGIALVTIYPGIVKYVPNIVYKIGGNDIIMDITVFVGVFVVIGYLIYWTNKQDKQTLNLIFKCFLFAFIGFTSYTMIIIRSNQDTPINLNSPKTFSEVMSYLNREQYGDFPTFKRRFSQEAHQQAMYSNYSSDLDFFVSYQMDHMLNRYLLWNYAGRNSTVQDAGVDWSKLLGIPFFLALFGLYFHFKKDWKFAAIFLMLFMMLGYIMTIYFNSQQPQPRERDYFYIGAFFVFSMWIGIGVRGLLDLTKEYLKDISKYKSISGGILILGLLFIPINMLRVNFHEHDRSRNYVPWDYSYNLLQSVAPNAILFTNGDNDTFPLWYLQDVESVRRDVRIANLSLLNTPWYIHQLKNTEPHGAPKIDMTLSDAQIDNLRPQRFEPQNVSVAVPKEIFEEWGVTDTSITNSGRITWTMNNTVQFGDIKAIRVQDIVVVDMIKASRWKRPIYFAVTSSEQSKLGLDTYLQMEGLAFRLVPKAHSNFYQIVEPEIMERQLLNEPDGYSTEYQPGFKFRGLADSTIFFDDNHQRLSLNYRNSFIRLAIYHLYEARNYAKTIEILDKMEEKLPRGVLPIRYELLYDVGNLYYGAGAVDRYKEFAGELETIALNILEENPMKFSGQYNPYQMLIEIYSNLKEYNKAIDILLRLQTYVPNDPQVKSLLDRFRSLSKADSIEVLP